METSEKRRNCLIWNILLILITCFSFKLPESIWGYDLHFPGHDIGTEPWLKAFSSLFLGFWLFSYFFYFLFLMKKPFNFSLLEDLIYSFLLLGIGTIIFHFIAILYGAPFIIDFSRTFLWSLIMSSFTFFPCSLIFGVKTKEERENWLNMFNFQTPQTCVHTLVYFSTYLTVFGGWAGAFLIPLDWDRPWQVWPITCTYGAIGGYLLGLIFCLLINLFNLLTKDKLKI